MALARGWRALAVGESLKMGLLVVSFVAMSQALNVRSIFAARTAPSWSCPPSTC